LSFCICHGGSPQTAASLTAAGLSPSVVDARALTRQSRVILYLVRPQEVDAIANCELYPDSLIVSFLAAIPLKRIPVGVPYNSRVRVMPSAPDTIVKGMAIAGIFPRGNPIVGELLDALRVEQFPLDRESDIHAFTALAVCLPIVLAFARALGRSVGDGELLECALGRALPDFDRILRWAYSAEPRFATDAERERYIQKAATPGGVTEAMLSRIADGGSIMESMEAGVSRSQMLSRDPPSQP
jgi:pyrroline-5-carboxylate reductase